jgi:hypothetical protein
LSLETATYISSLNSANPPGGDPVSQADDHIRLLKATLQSTFPSITGAVTKTHTQINDLLEKAGGTMTGALVLSGDPTIALHPATKQYVDNGFAADTITITAGTGLSGGGDLTANRTISVSSGGISAAQLASDAVTTIKILDSNVTTAKIADLNVTTGKLADSSVTNAKMADNSVDSAEIVAGAVDPSHLSQKITMETLQATSSGNSKEYTSIPSWVKRITIQFYTVSLSAAGIITVQIGDSGGYETSGYTGGTALIGFSSASPTVGFGVGINSYTLNFSGRMTLEHMGSNLWVSDHSLSAPGVYVVAGGGAKALSDTLDRLKIMATDTAGATGAMTFDGGYVNIMYE